MDADVIVIGAGLAGSTAARDLHEAGRRVVVLEARDRLGGRAWSGTLPGTKERIEWGGTWIHPGSPPAANEAIARYRLPMEPSLRPTALVWHVDGRLVGPTDAPQRYAAAVDELASRIDTVRSRLDAMVPSERGPALAEMDVSVDAWLDGQRLSSGARSVLLGYAGAVGGGDPARIGVLPLIHDAIEDGHRVGDGWHDIGPAFSHGTASLVTALATGLDVRLRHVVRTIEHDEAGVSVHVDGGLLLRGAAAIVALPLNVWRDVRFEPALGSVKAAAAASGQPGHASKVIAVARGFPAGLIGLGWGVPLQALAAVRPVGQDAQLVVGFAGAGRVDANDRGAVERAVQAFVPGATILAHAGHDWSSDPFARGTWCALPPGWTTDGTFDALEPPEGRLAFAGGDIAPDGVGLLAGAMSSGARAARTVSGMLEGTTTPA